MTARSAIPAQGRDIVILGGEGIGVIAASVAHSLGLTVRGFLNDMTPTNARIGKFSAFPVLGPSDDWRRFDDGNTGFIVAFGAMQRSETVLRRVASLGIPSQLLMTLVSDRAHLDRNFSSVGRGCLVAPGAQVSVDATLSDHCAMMGGAYLGHDSILGEFGRLAAGAVVGAYCRLGRGVHVGTNATIRERVVVGDFSLIGSGAVVLSDVPPRSVVVGNPGRILRQLSSGEVS